MKNRSLHFWIIATSVIMTIISLVLHFSTLPDRMTAFERLAQIVEYHHVDETFSQRPVTTFLIKSVSSILSIGIGKAFVLVNFGFLLLSGYLVGFLSSYFNKSNLASILNVVLFFLTFSNFFIFFDPIYTYDEPIQYTFILLSMIALNRNRFIWFSLCFGMAMITKETSVILLPGLYLLYTQLNKGNAYKGNYLRLAFVAPLIIYSLYLGWYCSFESNLKVTSRLNLVKYNFQDLQHAIESIVSFLLVVAIGIYSSLRVPVSKLTSQLNIFRKAFIVTLIMNTLLVFFMAYARESRLFALPLFFVWPILSRLVLHESFTWRLHTDLKTLTLLLIVVLIGVGVYLGITEIYNPVIGSGAGGWFHFYFAILVSFIVFDVFFKKEMR